MSAITPKSKPRVVILGAGFGGLNAARELGKSADVTVVDRHNYQTFLPLLYQVSTAALAADHIAYPIRGALRKSGAKFRMGTPISVDHKNKTVKLDSSEVLAFDHLIVSMGSATADFGIPGVEEFTLGMKSIHEALTIRSEIMRRFEDLARFEDNTRLSIVVVGGGPTGVEMAGSLSELVKGPLRNDHYHASKHIDIYLLEAGPRLLPMFTPSLSEKTMRQLENMGVKVMVNTAVSKVEWRKTTLANGEVLPSEVVVWAAGVKGAPAINDLSLPVKGNRLVCEPSCQVQNYPYVWGVGDNAGVMGENGRPLPMVAPVALQQGSFVAKQIKRLSRGQAVQKFTYVDKGSMATIGRHKAVVQVKGIRMWGPLAWFAWLFLHVFYLLGGQKRIGTLLDWVWNYLTFDRGNRHIMDSL
jgi:NADH:ubiquinone reductase (H+-translocating)